MVQNLNLWHTHTQRHAYKRPDWQSDWTDIRHSNCASITILITLMWRIMWWLNLSIYLACHNICIPSRNEGYKLCLGKGKISHWNNYDNLQYTVYRKFAKCLADRCAHLLSITTPRNACCYISSTLLLTKPRIKKSYVFQGIADKKQSRRIQTQEIWLLVFFTATRNCLFITRYSLHHRGKTLDMCRSPNYSCNVLFIPPPLF